MNYLSKTIQLTVMRQAVSSGTCSLVLSSTNKLEKNMLYRGDSLRDKNLKTSGPTLKCVCVGIGEMQLLVFIIVA